MHNPHSTNSGMSSLVSLNKLLSVRKIAMNMYRIAIEKRKKSSVVESTPFSVNVLTNIPVDPNIIPARTGKSKYILFIIIFYLSYFIKFYSFSYVKMNTFIYFV